MTLAQVRVPEGTTETTQITSLLAGLQIEGALVTIDPAHTRAATARYLMEDKNADYLMAVKGNPKALLVACKRVATGLVTSQVTGQVAVVRVSRTPHVVVENGHGRISTWTT